jgi:hypothetical protein
MMKVFPGVSSAIQGGGKRQTYHFAAMTLSPLFDDLRLVR